MDETGESSRGIDTSRAHIGKPKLGIWTTRAALLTAMIISCRGLEGQNSDKQQGVLTHVVKKGETAFGIARKHGCAVVDIVSLNPQIEDIALLPQGETLRVPTSTTSQSDKPDSEIIEKKVFHIVKSGETLSEIAEHLGVDVADILVLNKGLNPDKIRVGQSIVVPQKKSSNTPPPPVKAQSVIIAGREKYPKELIENPYLFHQKADTRPTPDLEKSIEKYPEKKSLRPVYDDLKESLTELKKLPEGSSEYIVLRSRCIILANLLDGDRKGLLYSNGKIGALKFMNPKTKKMERLAPWGRSYLGDCSTEVATGITYMVADYIQEKHGRQFTTRQFDRAFSSPRSGFTDIFKMLETTGAGKIYTRDKVYDKDGNILPSFQQLMKGKPTFIWLRNIGEHGGVLLPSGAMCDVSSLYNKDGSGVGVRGPHDTYRKKAIHKATHRVCIVDHPEKIFWIMEKYLNLPK